ncbi:AAA family ATPase [Pseudophaeobacter sp.]|uniref:AAA family ATPase n=1 Tax=Pseudophaeobacter sp. TaxID=1971739 RepID=UPI0032954FF1
MTQSSPKNDNAVLSHNSALSVGIKSFRGLKDVHLDGLKQVNLLVGGNNSGKTSILEAIAILYAGDDLRKWLDVSFVREVRTFASGPANMSILDTLSWMFPSNDVELLEHAGAGRIELTAETLAGERALTATVSPFEGFLSEDELRQSGHRASLLGGGSQAPGEPIADHGIELTISYSSPSDGLFNEENTETFQIWSQVGLRTLSRRSSRQNIVQYIPPYGHRNSSTNITALSRSIRNDNASELNDLMSSLDDRIAGVELVTGENKHKPQIAIRLKDRRLVPVSVMGDGIRRGLSIALSILASNEGILLIDEIEAAFHVNAFSKIFDWMMMAAKKHKVQIIATTHSLEAIEEISKSTKDSKDLSAYLIESDTGGVAKKYTGGMLHRLVVEAGLDVRF